MQQLRKLMRLYYTCFAYPMNERFEPINGELRIVRRIFKEYCIGLQIVVGTYKTLGFCGSRTATTFWNVNLSNFVQTFAEIESMSSTQLIIIVSLVNM